MGVCVREIVCLSACLFLHLLVFVGADLSVCLCVCPSVTSDDLCVSSKLTESQEDTRRKLFGPKVTLEIPSVGGELIWYSCASDLDMAARTGFCYSSDPYSLLARVQISTSEMIED